MTNTHISPYQYQIQSVKIESERITGFFEVAASTLEIVLYEHLDKSYISGHIAILDDANIFENIDFLGNETVRIKIKIPETSQSITKAFYVRQVESSVNISDQSSVLLLHLVDTKYYVNTLINLQKKYEGRPHEIIDNVLRDNFFGVELKMNDEPIQAPIRFLSPNMTPLGVCRMMKDRATDAIGSPFYLFASLADDHLRFYSLKYMMNRPSITSKRPATAYRYNQAIASDDRLPPALAAYNITSMEYKNNENLNQLVANGDVGAQYGYHDPIANLTTSYKHSIADIYVQLFATSSSGLIPNAPTYDDRTTVYGKKMHDYDSKQITNVTTSRTFEEINNYHEDNSAAFHREKSVSKTLKNFLQKSTLDISVPGANFLTSDNHITTGHVIKIEALKNFVPEGTNSDLVDKKKSGDYLIYAARHSFSGQRYEVSLSCGKLSNFDGTTKGRLG